jgi:hypothetical protein
MENKQIEALEKLIVIKDQTIVELERQIQLLKNQSIISIPQVQTSPYAPPFIPGQPQQIHTWPYELQVTCGNGTSGSISVDNTNTTNMTRWPNSCVSAWSFPATAKEA